MSDFISHNLHFASVGDDAKRAISTLQNVALQDELKQSWIVNCSMTQQEIQELSRLTKRVCRHNPHGTSVQCHPIAYELNRMAYNWVSNNIPEGTPSDPVIDIGGTEFRTRAGDHICTLINDARTNARYTNIAVSRTMEGRASIYDWLLDNAIELHDQISPGHNWHTFNYLDSNGIRTYCDYLDSAGINQAVKFRFQGLFNKFARYAKYRLRASQVRVKTVSAKSARTCHHGSEKCRVQAAIGYMINVYDINIADIPTIFDNHGMTQLHVFMFLPDYLVDDLLDVDQTFYRCGPFSSHLAGPMHNRPEKSLYFKFNGNDYSNMYIHDHDNWRDYLEVTKIVTPKFTIVSEIVHAYGTFCHIKFTRVNHHCEGEISRFIPLKDRYAHLVIVPNLVKYYSSMSSNPFKHRIITDRKFVDKCLQQIENFLDTQISFRTFILYANSINDRVSYRSTEGRTVVLSEGVNNTSKDYHDLTISLYIMGLLQRKDQTQIIGKAINTEKGWWRRTIYSFVRLLTGESAYDVIGSNDYQAKLKNYRDSFDIDHNGVEGTIYYQEVNDFKCFKMISVDLAPIALPIAVIPPKTPRPATKLPPPKPAPATVSTPAVLSTPSTCYKVSYPTFQPGGIDNHIYDFKTNSWIPDNFHTRYDLDSFNPNFCITRMHKVPGDGYCGMHTIKQQDRKSVV